MSQEVCFRMKERFITIPLHPYFNADAISTNAHRDDGVFGLVTSFPAEDFPQEPIVYLNDTPFLVPPTEDGSNNNIECYHEIIVIEPDRYCRLHLLGACDNGSFVEVFQLVYGDGGKPYRVGLSNSLLKKPLYEEQVGLRFSHLHGSSGGEQEIQTRLWHQTVILDQTVDLNSIVLPDNPCYHIFAMTLERSCSE